MLRHPGDWVIMVTFLMAFILTIMPLPAGVNAFRPEWLSLVIIYWCMALPHRVGIGTAWLLGLLLDAAKGTLLGQHALAFAVIAFVTLKIHRRIRVFPLWQQAVSVLLLLLLKQFLVFWIDGMLGYGPNDGWYLMPAVVGMLLWPWIFIVLRDLRRRFGMT